MTRPPTRAPPSPAQALSSPPIPPPPVGAAATDPAAEEGAPALLDRQGGDPPPGARPGADANRVAGRGHDHARPAHRDRCADQKSTRLNSSHANISHAVFCLN